MMLEDEMRLAVEMLLLDDYIVVESPPTCGVHTCRGHASREEAEAVHAAIDSCYAPLRA